MVAIFELGLVYSVNHGSILKLDVSCSLDLLILDLLTD